MLVNVYRSRLGLIYEYIQDSEGDLMCRSATADFTFLGQCEKKLIFSEKKVKKTYTEQVRFLKSSGNGLLEASIVIPIDAQNVKVSYDIEEEE